MPKFYVTLEVEKIYKKQYDDVTIYASDENEAEEKARERAEDWGGNADEVNVEILDVSEE